MSAPSWSTIVHVRILQAHAASAEAVRTAVTRTFDTAESPASVTGESPARSARGTFSVDTAGRHFTREPAPLAPPSSGSATVALFGDIDAVDRVAAVLSAEFATDQFDDDQATLTMAVHPDTRP